MTTLILFTCLSQTLISLALRELHSQCGDTLCVDLDDNTHAILKAHSISSMALRIGGEVNWGERDTKFSELAMPGKQFGLTFPGTELPVWKVIGMDRLNFWYRGEGVRRQYDYLVAMNWERAYVGADLHNPLGWSLAKHSGREVVGVKVASLRTREWYDMLRAGGVPFRYLVVEKQSDVSFLAANGYNGRVELG